MGGVLFATPYSLLTPFMKPKGSIAVIPASSEAGRADMADDVITTTGIARHGATRLPSVDVDSFNLELKDEDGFLGDRASKGAFRKIFDRWRKPLRRTGKDPFGDVPSEDISKKALDQRLLAVIGHRNAKARLLEVIAQQFDQRRLVLDDQHAGLDRRGLGVTPGGGRAGHAHGTFPAA